MEFVLLGLFLMGFCSNGLLLSLHPNLESKLGSNFTYFFPSFVVPFFLFFSPHFPPVLYSFFLHYLSRFLFFPFFCLFPVATLVLEIYVVYTFNKNFHLLFFTGRPLGTVTEVREQLFSAPLSIRDGQAELWQRESKSCLNQMFKLQFVYSDSGLIQWCGQKPELGEASPLLFFFLLLLSFSLRSPFLPSLFLPVSYHCCP